MLGAALPGRNSQSQIDDEAVRFAIAELDYGAILAEQILELVKKQNEY